MNGILVDNFGGLGAIIAIGVIILALFIVLRFFRVIFSSGFLGFLLALVSYFVYDYVFLGKLKLVACIAFILSVCGFSHGSFFAKLFALLGTLLSAYLILQGMGFIA